MSAYATIHVGLKQLGIDQDDARDLYERQTGKRSLRDMSPTQHGAVIEELRRLGFEKASKGPKNRAQGPYAGKLQALWIACWNLGLAHDRTDAAMTAFVKRQTKIDHTRFLLDAEDADNVIEALKSWMARERKVNWSASRFMPAWTQANGYRIAVAQFAFLRAADPAFAELLELQHWLIRTHGPDALAPTFDDRRWIAIMNELGVHVRRAARR